MSLFKPAVPTKRVTVLVYGESGTGKTLAGLTFPRPAVIDTEDGTDRYAGKVKHFEVMKARTIPQLMAAISEIREDNGRHFDTLVIDSMSTFYDSLKVGHIQKNAVGAGAMAYFQRAEVNERMKPIYLELTGLPVNIVVTAREIINYEGGGKTLIKNGVRPDLNHDAPYYFDFVVRLTETHEGKFEKARGVVNLPKMLRVTWENFQPLIAAAEQAEDSEPEPDEDDTAREAQIAAMTAFFASVKSMSLAKEDWRAALGVGSFAEYGDWTDPDTAAKAKKAGQNFKAARLLNMGNSNTQQKTTN